ncbi:hypothetical protein CC86DRAFT_468569 [Ophiobolus disseminans]|uniref:Apple domain-containing protein n=1 Tax=Ophiobolus disseminans TaxID=1469910 RepID=A0A6A6ZTQ8_9PLEO|nr:hypothetical protein CC86DRAFT_468569 [Ophiobolus disseminans]
MMVLARRSLVALTLANIAFATQPWLEDTIVGRNLALRQSDTSKCDPFGYRSQNGQNYTTYCEQNNPFNDAQPPFSSPSMQDCMEHCSRFWGKREGCYGIVWVEKNTECWIRNSTTSTTNLRPAEGHYSALVKEGEMSGFDTKCPFPDSSVQTLSGVDGLGYTVNCNKVIQGSDECFSGVPKPCTGSYYGFHHTETMEQCLRICVDSHPLCKAVSWSPDLKIGFANCWLKRDFSESSLVSSPNNAGVLHSATITRIDPVEKTCPSDKAYVSRAGGNAKFDIHCGQDSAGSNITSIHSRNITSCMDACAQSDKKCVGVVFDSSLNNGFKNCYLKNTTSTTPDQPSATYAFLSGSGIPGSPSPSSTSSSSSPSSSSPSKAWIAGPVLGGIAALGLIAFAVFWLRRRKNKKLHEKNAAGLGGYAVAPPYSSGYQDARAYAGPPNELNGQDHVAREMPGTTKYAHAQHGQANRGQSQVQELPS